MKRVQSDDNDDGDDNTMRNVNRQWEFSLAPIQNTLNSVLTFIESMNFS